jgi:hypothetical protein
MTMKRANNTREDCKDPVKLKYKSPNIVEYGSVDELTGGGTSGMAENMPNQGHMLKQRS